MKNDSANIFLEDWMNGIMSDLEIHNRLDSLTMGFQLIKLELLKKDIDFRIKELEIFCDIDENFKHTLENTIAEGCVSKIDLAKALSLQLCELIKAKQIEAATKQQTHETKAEQETIEMKPVLKPEAVQMVFDILKDFFSPEQQAELKQIIKTGNKANNKLLFNGTGNRLTDTFKKLIEHDFITGCQKQDLINWIISNFTFTQQNKMKAFIYDTVEKTISRNFYPCKSPLIEIKNGQIQRVEQPRTKKYSKY